MSKWKLDQSFWASGNGGRQVCIELWQPWDEITDESSNHRECSAGGFSEYRVGGVALNTLQDGRFQVVQNREILTRNAHRGDAANPPTR